MLLPNSERKKYFSELDLLKSQIPLLAEES
jgi:hypothetical protein